MADPPQEVPLVFFEFAAGRKPCAGGPITGVVAHGGRDIPYKWIRLEPADGQPTVNRPVIILLHGMGVTAATFHGIAPYLFASHDLLVVDYNSFGAPARWPQGGVSPRMMALGIWHVVETLGLENVNLLGSSLGGGLALLIALQQPQRVRAIGLLNPAVYPQTLPRRYHLMRVPILGELLMAVTPPERFVEGIRYVGYAVPEKMSDHLWQSYRRNMAEYRNRLQLMDVIRHLPGNEREFVELPRRLHEIQQPTCIVWGKQERLIFAGTGQRLVNDLPHAELFEFPDLAHLPHEEAPERVGPVLSAFFQKTVS